MCQFEPLQCSAHVEMLFFLSFKVFKALIRQKFTQALPNRDQWILSSRVKMPGINIHDLPILGKVVWKRIMFI